MLLGAEFLAMILIVVYVGAVAVLFLFVVMMLDVDFVELRQGFLNYLPVGGLVGMIVLVELVLVLGATVISAGAPQGDRDADRSSDVSNTEALGLVLYTRYIYYFQAAGLVLLVAMIGAIVLTLRHRPRVKRQNIADAERAQPRRPRWKCARCRRGRGSTMTIGLGHYLTVARDPVHARDFRHFPQPQEHHRHPDVGRIDPARRSTSISSRFRPSSAISSGRCSRCWC